jgi:hypothetical protein
MHYQRSEIEPMSAEVSTHNLILAAGYKLIEDAWEKNGRRTYIHDDDASGVQMKRLIEILGSAGWEMDSHKLRSFRHIVSDDMIELEPGGSDTTGHFLHQIKALS